MPLHSLHHSRCRLIEVRAQHLRRVHLFDVEAGKIDMHLGHRGGWGCDRERNMRLGFVEQAFNNVITVRHRSRLTRQR